MCGNFCELISQVLGDAAHARYSGLGFRDWIVIGVGIDVVGIRLAILVKDKLDTGDVGLVVSQEALIVLDKRVVEILDDVECYWSVPEHQDVIAGSSNIVDVERIRDKTDASIGPLMALSDRTFTRWIERFELRSRRRILSSR